jgi:hypothetical protein
VLGGQRTAGAGQRQPNLELPRQRKTKEEQQPRHQRQKHRRLELESPAQRCSRRAQPQQHAHQHPERNQNAGGINQPMRPQLVQFFMAGVHQRQPLQKQHRKNARHQVQQQPAEKGQAEGA